MAFLFIASRSGYVQTRLARGMAAYLSDQLEADVEIDRLKFRLFRSLNLKGFLIRDLSADTLLYAGELDVNVNSVDFGKRRFEFNYLEMSRGIFRLKRTDTTGTTNLDFLTEYFSSDERDTTALRPFVFSVDRLSLSEMGFTFLNPFSKEDTEGINFDDLDVRDIHAEFGNFMFGKDSLTTEMKELRFTEKSGFNLLSMQALIKVGNDVIRARGLSLKTEHSDVHGSIALLHDEWSAYRDFLTSIEWDAEFSASRIAFDDIGFFAPGVADFGFDFLLHGQIDGPIANLNGRNMVILTGDQTVLRGDIDLSGLPDFWNTFIDFRISEFRTRYTDILKIGKGLSADDSWTYALPAELQRAGELAFDGYFTGFPQDFVAFGELQTDVGSFGLDVNLTRDSLRNGVDYEGNIEAIAIDAGKLFDVDSLFSISGKFNLSAFSRQRFERAYLKGEVATLSYKGYTYKDVQLDGELARNRFSGSLNSDDPNFDLSFNGIIDFSTAVPFYDFDADIHNLNLSALNLANLDRDLSVTTRLSLDGRGEEVSDMAGALSATQTLLCYGDSTLAVNDIQLSIFGDSLNRKINFDSDIADFTITGAFDPRELPRAFNNLVAEVMPALAEPKPLNSQQNFQFGINYVSNNSVTSLLIPEFKIAAHTTIYGTVDSKTRQFELLLRSPEIAYGGVVVSSLTADIGKISEVFKGRIFAKEFRIDSLIFENPDVDIEAYNDFVDLKTGWFGKQVNSSADLRAHIDFFDSDHFLVEVEPGFFNIRDVTWEIDEKAAMEKDSTSFYFENVLIHSGGQEVELNGTLSEDPNDSLSFAINALRLTTLDSMGLGGGLKIGGLLNTHGRITDFYRAINIESMGEVLGFRLDRYDLGDLLVSTSYRGASKSLGIKTELLKAGEKLIYFDGNYGLDGSHSLTGDLSLNRFDLSVLNAFGIPEISDFGGAADGSIAVSGTLKRPEMKGFVEFDQGSFKVDYLNTSFVFSERVRVEPDYFGIDYKPIFDVEGNKGFVVASAFHDNFRSWSYDISAEVTNFFALNTTREENDLYFGKAYATGTIQVGGYEDKLEINIDVKTEKGTDLSLPLDRNEEVAMENFVHFVSEEATREETREIDLTGVTMRLNVDATPDARFRVIFDEKAGDILRGRGGGKITLETTPTGEFNMFGRYEIFSGDYNFTLRSLINKQFDIRPGGTIGWYGDPYNADLDLSAVYSLRTPLYPIMIENRELYRTREMVNVVMGLGGKLTNPSIQFEIELPQATENERSQLASAVSSTNQLNQQAFALLILNKFIAISAPEQAGTGVVSGLAAFGNTNTSEFISNQLSSWLSDISNEFDIGLNYRPGDQITNQEIAVALSTQLFDERLLVSGSFGVTSSNEVQYTEGQSGILGDFLLEYMLTPDGKIRLKVFNETNPYEVFSTSTSMYTQGVGLVYQEDFNTVDEFLKKVGELFKDDKARSLP